MTKTYRSKGEGSVSYLANTQRWCGRIRIDGKTKAVYGKSRAEVVAGIASYRTAFAAGQITAASDPTVQDQLAAWLASAEMREVKQSTIDNYRMVIDCLIPQRIKDIRLVALKPAHVRSMLQELAGKSRSSRRLARFVLRAALEMALEDEKISRNPVVSLKDSAKIPANPKRVPLDAIQTKAILAYVQAHESAQWVAMYALTTRYGLRVGELIALRWDDLDLDAGLLSVSGTLDRRGVRTSPKTDAGSRTFGISETVVTALRAHQIEQASKGKQGPDGYVFTSRFSGPLSEKTPRDHLHRMLKACNIDRPEITWHDLRHGAATMLLAQGTPIQIVQQMGGWADIKTLIDTYSYVSPESTRQAASALEGILS